jgi:hypothetical protein
VRTFMPSGEKVRRIKPPCFIQLTELKELARLVCAFERAALPVFYWEIEGNRQMATQLDLFMGRPIFYFAKANEFRHYLGYRNSAGVEDIALSDSTMNPAYLYSPVIALKRLPSIFVKGMNDTRRTTEKFLSIEVSNLASLAKVGAYKVLFEEPPLPLFTFSSNNQWIIGAFTRIDEYEEASIFFYTTLDEPPSHSFLKYAVQRTTDTCFTNRIDEHGYVFLKVIKLMDVHPMVSV